jgi:hypothetical protein
VYALFVIELGPCVQLLDFLVFQNLEPVVVPVGHGPAHFSGVTTPTRLYTVATLTPKRWPHPSRGP